MNSVIVSVIIPALNEERVIGSCLGALTRQTFPAGSLEVILVDNGSTDRTIAIAREFEQRLPLRIIQKKGGCISGLRNTAAKTAAGEVLTFLDADCIPSPDWLERGVDLLRSGRFGVVGAHYTIPAGSSWVARAWYGDMATRKQGPVSYVPAGDLMVSRTVFLDAGGFDETIHTSEDCEFCQRIAARGLTVFGDPSLSVIHLGTPQTLKEFYRKQRWHGANVHSIFFRNIRQASGIKSTLFTFYTLACLCGTLIGIPIALWFGSWMPLLAPVLLVAGALLLGAAAAMARKKPAIWLALSALYLVYGFSRAMCVLASRPVRPDKTRDDTAPGGLYTNVRPL